MKEIETNLQDCLNAQNTPMFIIGERASTLGQKNGQGSHYWHILLAWRAIKDYGMTADDASYKLFEYYLMLGKQINNREASSNPILNHIWFGMIALAYQTSKPEGKESFCCFMEQYGDILCNKKLLPAMNKILKKGLD